MPEKYWLETLGCPKNEVDSAKLEGTLIRAGLSAASAPDRAHLVVVNTCAFIEAARHESVETILELSRSRRGGCEARGHGVPCRALRGRAGGFHARDRPRRGFRRSSTR